MKRLDAALGKARELLHRGSRLPATAELARFIRAAFGDRAEHVSQEFERRGFGALVLAVEALPVPEAGQALRATVCTILRAIGAGDVRGYSEAMARLPADMGALCDWGELPEEARGNAPTGPPSPELRAAARQVTMLDLAGGFLADAARLRPRPQFRIDRPRAELPPVQRPRPVARPAQSEPVERAEPAALGQRAEADGEAEAVEASSTTPELRPDPPGLWRPLSQIEELREWVDW